MSARSCLCFSATSWARLRWGTTRLRDGTGPGCGQLCRTGAAGEQFLAAGAPKWPARQWQLDAVVPWTSAARRTNWAGPERSAPARWPSSTCDPTAPTSAARAGPASGSWRPRPASGACPASSGARSASTMPSVTGRPGARVSCCRPRSRCAGATANCSIRWSGTNWRTSGIAMWRWPGWPGRSGYALAPLLILPLVVSLLSSDHSHLG